MSKNHLLRKHATTLVLIGAAGILSAYVLLVDRDSPGTAELQARRHSLLPVFREKELSRIELSVEGEKAELVRKPDDGSGDDVGKWSLRLGSATYETDDGAVRDLIRGLSSARTLRKLEPDVPAATTGLDRPRVRVVLHMGSRTYVLALGNPAPSPKGAVYAMLQGRGRFVVDGTSARAIAKHLDAYRSRHVVALPIGETKTISLQGPEGKTVLLQAPWGGFRCHDEQGPRADASMIDRLSRAFADLTVQRFLAPERAAELVNHDSRRITVRLVASDKDRTTSFSVGATCPGEKKNRWVVLSRTEPSPMGACVRESVLQALSTKPDAFVDAHLLAAKPSEIEMVQVKSQGRVLEIARRGHGWHQRRPVDRELRGEDGDNYVKALLRLEGSWSQQPPPFATNQQPPEINLLVRLAADPSKQHPEQRLSVYADPSSEEHAWVLRGQDGAWIHVSSAVARQLEPSPVLLRSTRLVDVPPMRVQWVEVEIEGKKFQRIERKNGSPSLVHPPGYDVDAALASDLFDTVAGLHAVRWIAPRDDGRFGLSHPYARVSFRLSGDAGPLTRTLLVGSVGPDGRYARWEPDTGVFVLSSGTIRSFVTYDIDRSVFMFDPTVVQRVKLRAGKRKVMLYDDGETWKGKDENGKIVPQSMVDRVREALVSLRAEGVVHLGSSKPEEGFGEDAIEVVYQPRKSSHRKQVVWVLGSGDVWRGTNVVYARRKDIGATYVVARSRIEVLMELLGSEEGRERPK